ncbi:BICD family-like cargo adapter 2 [Pelobates fuscus]|uniref:BICD family-like cargo adapter 2 n=1 Tax=Pelobates fuscus TaxID=191477 RepID=UPI002FE4CF2D
MNSGGTESGGGVPRGWNGGFTSPSMEENFYPFLLERRTSYIGEEEEEQGEEDLSLALERKDKDLLLAAELGKALLERNDQLEREREAIEEELRETQERLEQEKHAMRLKMDVQESEWRAQITDLETDLAESRMQMRQFMTEQRECGRETASAVHELSDQNQRLLEQIAQASHLEQSLTAEIQSLRNENRELTLSRGHFTPCLQSLQSENALLVDKKRELESQIKQLREQYENAQNTVFTLKETTLHLEREKRENEMKMQQLQHQLQELRDSQRTLQIQLRELQDEQHIRDCQHSMEDSHYSLHSEIQQSTADHDHEFGDSPDGISTSTDGQLEMYLVQREGDIVKEREEEVAQLQNQVILQYAELESLREELHRLRDGSQQTDTDAVVRQAVCDRDEAILKKGELEMELAKCCQEKESLSRQLLSAVQQKVMLSQELEAWQDDMQLVINQQLKIQRVQEAQRDTEASPLTPGRRESTRRPRDSGGGIFSFLKRM